LCLTSIVLGFATIHKKTASHAFQLSKPKSYISASFPVEYSSALPLLPFTWMAPICRRQYAIFCASQCGCSIALANSSVENGFLSLRGSSFRKSFGALKTWWPITSISLRSEILHPLRRQLPLPSSHRNSSSSPQGPGRARCQYGSRPLPLQAHPLDGHITLSALSERSFPRVCRSGVLPLLGPNPQSLHEK